MSRPDEPRIAAIVPCYRVRAHILGVLAGLSAYADAIFVIDDACPEHTGEHVRQHVAGNQVRVITHAANQGVGAATVTGYRAALSEGFDILLKLDGDGQMNPVHIPALLAPLRAGQADYAKGNRLATSDDRRAMPASRIVGNLVISRLARWMTKYRHVMDPMNGFTAITAATLGRLDLDALDRRFFFETDLLCHLSDRGAVVVDVPMPAHYGTERSNLRARDTLLGFPPKIIARLLRSRVRNRP